MNRFDQFLYCDSVFYFLLFFKFVFHFFIINYYKITQG